MKYINFLLYAIILTFSTVYIYNIFILKCKWKENFKVSSLFILLSLPMSIFISLVAFVILKCTNWILPLNISNYKLFILSFASIFIVFIGELIIKVVLSNLVSKYLENKHKDENLSQEQMISLIEEKHIIIESLKAVSMLVISCFVCIIITITLHVENSIIISFVVSIANSISYLLIFKSK